MNMAVPDKAELERLYCGEKMPMHRIAKEMSMAVGKVFKYIKIYNIKTRPQKETFTMKGRKLTPEQCEAISRRKKGKLLSEETRQKMSEAKKLHCQGHKKKRKDGYIAIYFPDYPKSSKDGYVMEHVFVVEQAIGRNLNDDECVHHINAKRDDNRIENLRLMTKREHASYHSKQRWEKLRGGMTYQ